MCPQAGVLETCGLFFLGILSNIDPEDLRRRGRSEDEWRRTRLPQPTPLDGDGGAGGGGGGGYGGGNQVDQQVSMTMQRLSPGDLGLVIAPPFVKALVLCLHALAGGRHNADREGNETDTASQHALLRLGLVPPLIQEIHRLWALALVALGVGQGAPPGGLVLVMPDGQYQPPMSLCEYVGEREKERKTGGGEGER